MCATSQLSNSLPPIYIGNTYKIAKRTKLAEIMILLTVIIVQPLPMVADALL